MAEEFLAKSAPDSMFPCSTNEMTRCVLIDHGHNQGAPWTWGQWKRAGCYSTTVRDAVLEHALAVLSDEKSAYDALGRCKLKCANCNCRMLFNQLECVKADLETTKETLQETKSELHSTKESLQETEDELHSVKCELEDTIGRAFTMSQLSEEKRKFATAIAKMVRSEMSDVRTQLSVVNLCLKEELDEKALEKKAASEAAKAALSASNDITLRLLMF